MGNITHSIRLSNQNEPHSQNRLAWTTSPNQRGSIDIIWSCCLVLFVCIWAVLHHNIPLKSESIWTTMGRKLRWATLGVAAPELLTLFSIMQWNAANVSVREMRDLGDKDWSVVHAFYANAGGFVIQTPDCPAFPLNATSIHYLRSTGWVKEVTITREDIWDRSKADLFAKGFAMLQTSWLLIQCTARLVQRLSITPIELFTLAFLVPTVSTGFFLGKQATKRPRAYRHHD